jgi:rhodanese-related sulfurtransferase
MIGKAVSTIQKLLVVLIPGLILVSCTKKEASENAGISKPSSVQLSPEEFRAKLANTPDAVLIDVRKPEELQPGIIEGAINIDYTDSSFTERVGKLDKTKSYFVYCKSGKRSSAAVVEMEKLGFKNMFVLEGGYTTWQDAGLETVKPE